MLLLLGGHDPGTALSALVRGAAGSMDRFLSVTLVRAVPLVLAGLAVALAFRAGVFNIGAEGQLYAGAVAAAWIGAGTAVVSLPRSSFPVVLLPRRWRAPSGRWSPPCSAPHGGGRGHHHPSPELRGDVPGRLDGARPPAGGRGVFPQTDPIAGAARLPVLVPGTRLHAGMLLAVGAALLLHLVLRHTAVGFRVKAAGASPGRPGCRAGSHRPHGPGGLPGLRGPGRGGRGAWRWRGSPSPSTRGSPPAMDTRPSPWPCWPG
jgi:general nucleoside transport system permease protein